MIIVIKGKDYKRLAIKGMSLLLLVLMFIWYYNHMASKFQEQNKNYQAQTTQSNVKAKENKSQEYEHIIYKESKVITSLVGQKYIQSVKVQNGRLVVICNLDTNIEPIMIRYGASAFVYHTNTDIKIAIDLKTIVENKYEKN